MCCIADSDGNAEIVMSSAKYAQVVIVSFRVVWLDSLCWVYKDFDVATDKVHPESMETPVNADQGGRRTACDRQQ